MDNLEALIEAGVIPAESRGDLTEEDLATIETLSQEEVASVISITYKFGKDFFKRLCPHGAFF